MVKLCRVLKVEVGSPGDFARLGKEGILEKLQEKGGAEALQRPFHFKLDVGTFFGGLLVGVGSWRIRK